MAERQKSLKLQDMVEKLLTKLKGYYSKKSNNDTAEKLRKAEKEIADQKQIIYEMRKEMQFQ